MLKIRIQICIVYSIFYLFVIKEKTDYRINTVSDRFHPLTANGKAPNGCAAYGGTVVVVHTEAPRKASWLLSLPPRHFTSSHFTRSLRHSLASAVAKPAGTGACGQFRCRAGPEECRTPSWPVCPPAPSGS
jgi:hypothetical protein